jgi:hypothetical protein
MRRAALLGFAGLCALTAALTLPMAQAQPPREGARQAQRPVPDWASVERETLEHFQAIR